MHADTLLFLDRLFNRCKDVPAAITLTAIHPDGRHRTPSRHIPVRQSEPMDKALDALDAANVQGWGAYVALGLRHPGLTRWQRGGLSDVVVLPALFVDIDNDSEVVQQRLMTSSLTPSLLVHSGGGYHAYWFLNEPTPDLDFADRILEGLATYFGGDRLSPAASLRLPGTHNTKPGRNGVLCHLVHHTDCDYRLNDFGRFIQREAVPPAATHGQTLNGERRLNPEVIEAVVHRLYCDYRARKARGGWIPALCPCGHARDSPGAHFSFNPDIGCGRCHGRHGTLRLTDLCSLLGMDAAAYGGIFKRKDTSV
jgi:RepB DNA-primase from phage plasmid